MNNLPSGTVTFLFTDIEGSTKRWEAYPQQMQLALQRHDSIVRSAIEAQGGYIFKTMGDAFYVAFPTPLSALAATREAQRSLLTEQWDGAIGSVPVRMSLHTGMVEARGGDYFGQPLNRVARLLSAGHGGQTLVSAATQELVRDHLPPGITLLDMGEHRLKDLVRPEHIFQLVAPGLPTEFPPLRTLESHLNNLPLQPTPFIGREKELASVVALLRHPDVRLVTLTGPGGTGKTRLALQAAAELLEDFPDGVFSVELAALTDPSLVPSTIAQTLRVMEGAGKPLIESLKDYLHDKHLLLVLDNFEQVASAASVADALMKSASHLKIVVTSRVNLRLYGEHAFPVPPFDLPDPNHLPPLERLTQYEVVQLFIERAQAAKPDFQVTNENASAVAKICVRLDGLPLAIELAAARVRLLPPNALLSRLSSRLKMLTGGGVNVPARQQTLRGAIEWSYDLLSEGEQQLFRRMAVFQGGRSLEALEAVCNSEGLQIEGTLQVDLLDGAESLMNSSLLQQRDGRDGEPRLWMLETIHEYAREKLQGTAVYGGSGEAEALSRQHALYFMRLAEEAEPHLTDKRQQEWLDRLEDEYDNIRAALGWSGEQANGKEGEGEAEAAGEGEAEGPEVGLRIGGAIWRFWFVRGLFTEGREHLGAVLARHSTSSAPPASPTSPAPTLYSTSGIAEGSEAGRQQQSLSRSRSTSRSRAKALNGAGVLARRQGDYSSARALHEESLAFSREMGDKSGIAYSLNLLGSVAQEQGDYTSARALNEESLALMRELGDKSGTSYSLMSFGAVALLLGDYTEAHALLEESLALGRELGDKSGISYSLNSLGLVAAEQGDYTGARALHSKSLALRMDLGDKKGIAASLAGLGGVAVRVGDAERGTKLLGAVEMLLQSISAVLYREDRLPYERSVEQAREVLGEEEFEKAWQEGRARSMEEAVEYGLEER